MNSPEYDIEALDDLFRQALQSERRAYPSRRVWRRVLEALALAPPRPRPWQHIRAFFYMIGLFQENKPPKYKRFSEEKASGLEGFNSWNYLGAAGPLIMTVRPVRAGEVELLSIFPLVGAIFGQTLGLRMIA